MATEGLPNEVPCRGGESTKERAELPGGDKASWRNPAHPCQIDTYVRDVKVHVFLQ